MPPLPANTPSLPDLRSPNLPQIISRRRMALPTPGGKEGRRQRSRGGPPGPRGIASRCVHRRDLNADRDTRPHPIEVMPLPHTPELNAPAISLASTTVDLARILELVDEVVTLDAGRVVGRGGPIARPRALVITRSG